MALNEYMQTEQVSDYFAVDIYAINKDNVEDYIKERSKKSRKCGVGGWNEKKIIQGLSEFDWY